MDTIGKEEVKRFIEVFYPNSFKTFFINSNDGMTFVSPEGIFVSLGLTTPFNTIENLVDIINNSLDYSAKLVEISSVKVSGQFLNYILGENPKQYRVDTKEMGMNMLLTKSGDSTSKLLDQSDCCKELEELKNMIYPDQDLRIVQEYTPKILSLQKVMTKIIDEGGWDNFWVIKTQEGEYKLFRRNMNYMNCGDVEYRVGIYVTKKIV